MLINTKNLISITEANQNFLKVAEMVDENGAVIVLKDDAPRYLILEFGQVQNESIASEEEVMDVAQRIITRNLNAFLELAK